MKKLFSWWATRLNHHPSPLEIEKKGKDALNAYFKSQE